MSYAQRLAECRKAVSLKKKALMADRLEKTKEITRKWNEGFRALKEENDRLQKEVKEWYLSEDQMLSEEYGNCNESAQI